MDTLADAIREGYANLNGTMAAYEEPDEVYEAVAHHLKSIDFDEPISTENFPFIHPYVMGVLATIRQARGNEFAEFGIISVQP